MYEQGCPFDRLHEDDPELYWRFAWCSRSITSEDRKDYGDADGKRVEIGSRTVYRPSLEWLEFNLRADRIKPRDWSAARDWTLSIAALSTGAVEEEERRQDAISENRARYQKHWALVRERRQADGG